MFTTIQERTGRVIDDLISPDFPHEMEYLWLQYLEIRKGSAQIGYAELNNYALVSGCRLTPWEADTIMKIDRERLSNHG